MDTAAASLSLKRHLGFITCNEESFYGHLTGWQNLAFFARLHNLNPKDAVPPVARRLKLGPYLDRRFFPYSTGIKRRFDIARGLLHQPDILLLDEPTINLDPIATAEVRDLLAQLQEQGKTMIIGDAPPGGGPENEGPSGHHEGRPLTGSAARGHDSLEDLYWRVVQGEGHGPS